MKVNQKRCSELQPWACTPTTVAVGRPDFLEEDRDYDEWTEEEEEFDCQIFHYYEDYAELNQHLKDGDETYHDFIVTKIINQ